MGGDLQFSEFLRGHFDDLSRQIASRQHRCVRGFLQALFGNLQPFALGLLELDMLKANPIPKWNGMRYWINITESSSSGSHKVAVGRRELQAPLKEWNKFQER
jgi:hypothetical protein